MRVQLDRTVKVGDILTSLTIFISVIALILSLAKDREARLTEQANKIRSAAANALLKLDRWQAIQLSLYQELQPTFVELSESLAGQFDVAHARDQFWKRVNTERTRVARQVLDEQLGTAYSELLSHFPAARTKFVDTFSGLSDVENKVTESFLAECEQSILSLRGQQKNYSTPVLGNALRQVASNHARQLKAQSEAVISPIREYLFSVIAMQDSEIVNASRAKRDG